MESCSQSHAPPAPPRQQGRLKPQPRRQSSQHNTIPPLKAPPSSFLSSDLVTTSQRSPQALETLVQARSPQRKAPPSSFLSSDPVTTITPSPVDSYPRVGSYSARLVRTPPFLPEHNHSALFDRGRRSIWPFPRAHTPCMAKPSHGTVRPTAQNGS